MASVVEICNLALSWLGGNPITSIDDTTTEGALCKANYELQRDAVLQEADWTFAIKRVELPINATDLPWGNWNGFALPGDYIRILSISETNADNRYVDWRIEGKNIIANTGTCYCRYIYRVTNPQEFPPLFVHALAAKMASDMAIPLTRSVNLRNQNEQLYMMKLRQAASADGIQGKSDRIGRFNLGKVRYASTLARYGIT